MTATAKKTPKAPKTSKAPNVVSIPAFLPPRTPEEHTAMMAAPAPKAASKGKTTSPAPRANDKDAQTLTLISRPEGATVAEIRKATGWKGVIENGPKRVAKAAGRKLAKPEGEGEERIFKFV